MSVGNYFNFWFYQLNQMGEKIVPRACPPITVRNGVNNDWQSDTIWIYVRPVTWVICGFKCWFCFLEVEGSLSQVLVRAESSLPFLGPRSGFASGNERSVVPKRDKKSLQCSWAKQSNYCLWKYFETDSNCDYCKQMFVGAPNCLYSQSKSQVAFWAT